MTTLVWFRQDLRLGDNPALHHACQTDDAIIPVYIWEPEVEKPWQPGGASRWWLHHSLDALHHALKKKGSQLIIRRGISLDILQQLIRECHVRQVVWNRRYEPAIKRRDEKVKSRLKEQGIDVQSFNGSLLHEPMSVKTKEGKPYQVYTPMWKAYQQLEQPRHPLPAPKQVPVPKEWPETESIDSLQLLPRIPWDKSFYTHWQPGEAAAQARLIDFCKEAVTSYQEQRDLPGIEGTSRLSPALHFGEISPNQIWHRVQRVRSTLADLELQQSEVYLKELVWREFAYHLLYHYPHTPTEPLRSEFNQFPWKNNARSLKAWQHGLTGYPIVDAGMRQLWTTGWMHNRLRMVVASFLVKHLLIPWQRGVEWFWDTLVDADLASNTLGWQWTAGCGADAAPYFRIFNPMQQQARFDPTGAYVKRWVPELQQLPTQYLPAPWTAPRKVLLEAGITLGKTYPMPIVEHTQARAHALEAYATMRGK